MVLHCYLNKIDMKSLEILKIVLFIAHPVKVTWINAMNNTIFNISSDFISILSK
jgi:hypothetical protein